MVGRRGAMIGTALAGMGNSFLDSFQRTQALAYERAMQQRQLDDAERRWQADYRLREQDANARTDALQEKQYLREFGTPNKQGGLTPPAPIQQRPMAREAIAAEQAGQARGLSGGAAAAQDLARRNVAQDPFDVAMDQEYGVLPQFAAPLSETPVDPQLAATVMAAREAAYAEGAKTARKNLAGLPSVARAPIASRLAGMGNEQTVEALRYATQPGGVAEQLVARKAGQDLGTYAKKAGIKAAITTRADLEKLAAQRAAEAAGATLADPNVPAPPQVPGVRAAAPILPKQPEKVVTENIVKGAQARTSVADASNILRQGRALAQERRGRVGPQMYWSMWNAAKALGQLEGATPQEQIQNFIEKNGLLESEVALAHQYAAKQRGLSGTATSTTGAP